jgi:hypothetical protein
MVTSFIPTYRLEGMTYLGSPLIYTISSKKTDYKESEPPHLCPRADPLLGKERAVCVSASQKIKYMFKYYCQLLRKISSICACDDKTVRYTFVFRLAPHQPRSYGASKSLFFLWGSFDWQKLLYFHKKQNTPILPRCFNISLIFF